MARFGECFFGQGMFGFGCAAEGTYKTLRYQRGWQYNVADSPPNTIEYGIYTRAAETIATFLTTAETPTTPTYTRE